MSASSGVATVDHQRALRWRGTLLTVLGVLLLCPDSLLVKETAISPEGFLFWRGSLLTFAFLAIALIRYRVDLPNQIRRCGWRGLYCATAFSFSTTGFVVGMKYTAAGNVLVILDTAPVIAAILGFLIWGERLPLRTWIVILICVAGATLMGLSEAGPGQLLGLSMSVMAAFALASNLAVARSRPEADMSVMLMFGAALTALMATLMGGAQWPSHNDMGYILLLCLVFLPAASTLIQSGPRYLPAAEVSLMLLLETVFGSLLVWLFLGEVPPTLSLIGGAIILAALIANGLFDLLRQRQRRRIRPPLPPH